MARFTCEPVQIQNKVFTFWFQGGPAHDRTRSDRLGQRSRLSEPGGVTKCASNPCFTGVCTGCAAPHSGFTGVCGVCTPRGFRQISFLKTQPPETLNSLF